MKIYKMYNLWAIVSPTKAQSIEISQILTLAIVDYVFNIEIVFSRNKFLKREKACYMYCRRSGDLKFVTENTEQYLNVKMYFALFISS